MNANLRELTDRIKAIAAKNTPGAGPRYRREFAGSLREALAEFEALIAVDEAANMVAAQIGKGGER